MTGKSIEVRKPAARVQSSIFLAALMASTALVGFGARPAIAGTCNNGAPPYDIPAQSTDIELDTDCGGTGGTVNVTGDVESSFSYTIWDSGGGGQDWAVVVDSGVEVDNIHATPTSTIWFQSPNASLDNFGAVKVTSTTAGYTVLFSSTAGVGTVTNRAGATISNAGSSPAVSFQAGGTVVNEAGGQITATGTNDAISVTGGFADLTNGGIISAANGYSISGNSGGTVVNNGTISGGVNFFGSGTLELTNNGSLLNGTSASAIRTNAIDATVINSGAISGGSSAIDFSGTGEQTLILLPGSVIIGTADAGFDTDTLEFSGATGADSFDLNDIGSTAQYRNFETFMVTGSATWTFSGSTSEDFTADGGMVGVDASGATFGNLTIENAGTVDIGGNVLTVDDFGLVDGTVANGTVIATNYFVENGEISADLTGAAPLSKSGVGTVTLTGANSYTGGTNISGGALIGDSSSLQGDITNNAALVFDQAGAGTYAGVVSGAGSLTKEGAGALTLTGPNTYTGGTTVSAGTLLVNGSIGDVLVNGGVLGGSGTLGAVTFNSGSTFAPGNSIGTTNVGNVVFNTGSLYEVEVNDGGNVAGVNNDLISASGMATINGGMVSVVPENGTDDGSTYALNTTYTILTATGGVTGTFGSVVDSFAFLDATLDYDTNNVYLMLERNSVDFAGIAETPNQTAAAGGVESLGLGNALFGSFLLLTADEGRTAFDLLSGEIHASAQTSFIEDSRFIRAAANDRVRAAFESVASSATPLLGYADGGDPHVAPAHADSVAIWGQAFGARGNWDSNGNAAAMHRAIGGFLMGADAAVMDNFRLGLVAGYSHSGFDVDDRASSGSADSYHLGAYGGAQLGDLGLRFGAAYGWNNIDTSRSVAFPGFSDTLSASYNSTTAQLFGEAGYRIDMAAASFEPYAGIAHVNLKTGGFTENGGAAALTRAESMINATFTTLGVRAETEIVLGNATTATFSGGLGWRHAFGDLAPTSEMALAGGSPFTIAGVPIARDALVLDLGVDVALSPTARLGFDYTGQIGAGASEHGVKAGLAVTF